MRKLNPLASFARMLNDSPTSASVLPAPHGNCNCCCERLDGAHDKQNLLHADATTFAIAVLALLIVNAVLRSALSWRPWETNSLFRSVLASVP